MADDSWEVSVYPDKTNIDLPRNSTLRYWEPSLFTVDDSDPVPPETAALTLWCQGRRLLPEPGVHCWANTRGVAGLPQATGDTSPPRCTSLAPARSPDERGVGSWHAAFINSLLIEGNRPASQGHVSFIKRVQTETSSLSFYIINWTMFLIIISEGFFSKNKKFKKMEQCHLILKIKRHVKILQALWVSWKITHTFILWFSDSPATPSLRYAGNMWHGTCAATTVPAPSALAKVETIMT